MGISDMPSQFPRGQVGTLQCDFHDQLPDRLGNPIPVLSHSPALILKAIQPTRLIGAIPTVEATSADPDLLQRATDGQLGVLYQPDRVAVRTKRQDSLTFSRPTYASKRPYDTSFFSGWPTYTSKVVFIRDSKSAFNPCGLQAFTCL